MAAGPARGLGAAQGPAAQRPGQGLSAADHRAWRPDCAGSRSSPARRAAAGVASGGHGPLAAGGRSADSDRSPAQGLRHRPAFRHPAGDTAPERGHAGNSVGKGSRARPGGRLPRSGRRGPAEQSGLRPGGPRPCPSPGRRRADPGRRQPAVPPADGLRRGHEDNRPFRAGSGPHRPLGAATDAPAGWQVGGALRPAPAHPSPCPARAQRLLQPREEGPALRLFPGAQGQRRRQPAGRHGLHLPIPRHHRPRDDPRPAGRTAPTLPRTDQRGRPGLPRGLCRHRGPFPALHHPRGAPGPGGQDPG